jgi:hypothetical protein
MHAGACRPTFHFLFNLCITRRVDENARATGGNGQQGDDVDYERVYDPMISERLRHVHGVFAHGDDQL